MRVVYSYGVILENSKAKRAAEIVRYTGVSYHSNGVGLASSQQPAQIDLSVCRSCKLSDSCMAPQAGHRHILQAAANV